MTGSTNKSGQQVAKEALQAFVEFLEIRDQDGDWTSWADKTGCVMSPKKVCDALGIGTAALRQNPRIATLRKDKEKELQSAGVFTVPQEKAEVAPAGTVSTSRDKIRIKQLEEKNAEQKEEIRSLKLMLKKSNIFKEHLLETGRAIQL